MVLPSQRGCRQYLGHTMQNIMRVFSSRTADYGRLWYLHSVRPVLILLHCARTTVCPKVSTTLFWLIVILGLLLYCNIYFD